MFAIAPHGPYYGVSGTTSVWNPKVSNGQTSASHLYIENGKGDDNNKIVVGWHVSFSLSYYYTDFTFILKSCMYILV